MDSSGFAAASASSYQIVWASWFDQWHVSNFDRQTDFQAWWNVQQCDNRAWGSPRRIGKYSPSLPAAFVQQILGKLSFASLGALTDQRTLDAEDLTGEATFLVVVHDTINPARQT